MIKNVFYKYNWMHLKNNPFYVLFYFSPFIKNPIIIKGSQLDAFSP